MIVHLRPANSLSLKSGYYVAAVAARNQEKFMGSEWPAHCHWFKVRFRQQLLLHYVVWHKDYRDFVLYQLAQKSYLQSPALVLMPLYCTEDWQLEGGPACYWMCGFLRVPGKLIQSKKLGLPKIIGAR